MEKYKNEILELVSSYSIAHEELNEIERLLEEHTKNYEKIISKLTILRDKEKQIINNIEKETGNKISSEDFINYIK